MTKDPYFAFFPSDWLGSTRIALMDAAQERGLLRLLCHLWASDDCSLPDDDRVLAALSLIGQSWHDGAGDAVRACLMPHPSKPGAITNPKLLALKQGRDAWREKCSRGGKATQQRRKVSSTTLQLPLQVKGQLNANIPYPYPYPSPKPTEKTHRRRPPARPMFVPPTVDEVREYCQETSLTVDAAVFCDFYTSNGWLVGKNRMKDWRAACRNWARNGTRRQATAIEGTRRAMQAFVNGARHE